jgi:cytochrome P450
VTTTLPTTTLPPGPALPPLAQTVAAVGAPGQFYPRARKRYGDVFTVRFVGAPPFVMVSDPDAIRDVFTGPADVMLAGESNAVLEPLLGARSLLLLDREEHLRERRRLLPPFHGARIKTYERIMERATLREVEGWPVGRPFALLPGMQEITLEVVMRAVLGVATGERYEQLARAIRRVLAPGGGRLRTILGLFVEDTALQRRFAGQVAAVDDLVYAEIADRRGDPGDDVLSMLIGAGLTDRELRDEVVTLLVAGHETTATGLAWAFERLLRHPEALERCREDATYLDAAIKETLRVRPVLWAVGRVLGREYEIGGYRLPAGTRVLPSITLTHLNEAVHHHSRAFRPERFLGDDQPSTYEWLPFGGGMRRCIGASFALLEMRVVVQTVLAHARLEADGDEDEPVNRSSLVLIPGRGARVIRRA